MAFPWAALISGAGSLISGIMGNRSAEAQNAAQIRAIQEANRRAEQREDTRIQRVVQDARAAGIHPLAALGSPSVGTFATPMAAYGGAPISGSAVGEALSAAGAAMPAEGSTSGLQEQLLKAQIANVNASTQQLLADATSRTKIAMQNSNQDQFGNPVTSYSIMGVPVQANPNTSDVGGPIQQRHGEGAEWLAMLPAMLADAYYSAGHGWRESVERARQRVQEAMRSRGVQPF